MKPKLITVTLSKTVSAMDFDEPSAALNKLIIELAQNGWILDFSEMKIKTHKYGGIELGSE
jgi:hypothetical protein